MYSGCGCSSKMRCFVGAPKCPFRVAGVHDNSGGTPNACCIRAPDFALDLAGSAEELERPAILIIEKRSETVGIYQ